MFGLKGAQNLPWGVQRVHLNPKRKPEQTKIYSICIGPSIPLAFFFYYKLVGEGMATGIEIVIC